jgi:glycosyltransferase involved in cell wall biosynthesis
MTRLRLLNCSTIAFNDKHNYFGGAIGNIAFNLASSLVEETDTELTTFVTGTDLADPTPSGLTLVDVDDYDDIAAKFDAVREETDPDAYTHLYCYEPSRNPVVNDRAPMDRPLVIGMCERPHNRYADETSGIERFKLVRVLGRLALLPLFKRTLRACDKLIVVDEAAKRYYGDYIPEERIDVVPYGVDLDMFEPSPLPDQPRILVVSRLIRRRRIRDAIDALGTLVDDFSGVELHLVGEGPQRDALAERASERGVREAVTFHGNIGPEALVQRYRDAYVYCHLSEEDGWNQTALEAMASGRPVVATDEPHNSMVRDGETGSTVPVGDVAALERELRALFRDRTLARNRGDNGRAVAEREYGWAGVASEYVASIRDVL